MQEFLQLRYFHAYKFSGTRMTQRMVQCTTVRKTLRTSPGAWACRRTWDAAVGQDEDGYCEPPVHRQRVRQTVAQMSRTRETEHLSFRPVSAWLFLFLTSSPPFLPSSSDFSPASGTYRIALIPPTLDTEPEVKTAFAEEGWLCTNSPTWDAHFRTLSSSTLLARAALHLVEHLRTRSHPSEGSIARSWRVTSGPRSRFDRGHRAIGENNLLPHERCRSMT